MKKIISCIVIVSFLFSCNSGKKGNMTAKGTVDGLKKGTLYLQKYKDTLLVSVDSIKLNGTGEFILTDNLESPEVYFIVLDKKETEKIPFFGEKGEILISTKLAKFATSAKITGSKNQELLDKYNEMLKKFNNKQLDLVKEKFDAYKNNDTALISKVKKEENSLIRRKYYYTTNYAVNNADYEVAPYLALTGLYYANIKLLDTINNSLSKKVKKSKYGLELAKFIEDIKSKEK